MRCHWHPDTETALTCGRCDRPVCLRCVREHPVGVRCKECARPAPVPTLQVSPLHYLRAILASLFLGVAGGVAIVLVDVLALRTLPFLFWFRLLLLLGVGYVIGEGVSLSVNRKRGRGLQIVAASGVVVSATVALLLGDTAIFQGLFSVLALVLAVLIAASRMSI